MRLGVDLFCGGGGATAGAEASGEHRTVFAANHWDIACQTFRRNFPHARVARARIDEVHPGEVEKLHTLHASPPCPGHSNGRGNKPTSDRERADPWDILKWFTHHKIEDAIIENVPGFVNWGPVDPKTGRPDPKHKAWIRAIQACGHTVEYQKMDPADFGAKTSRPRLIVRTRLGKRGPKWPEPTHVGRWVACRDALDLTTKGRGIAGRICENTLRRIADGRALYGDKPFLVEYYGNSSTASLDRPLPTITTHDRHGLVIGDTLRVLFNHELAKCQGFADDFVFVGNRTEITTQIGNSVPPELSRALCLAIAG